MEKQLSLILFNTRVNRYSFNALAGAIETEESFAELKILFISREDELLAELKKHTKRDDYVVVAFSFFTTQVWHMARIVTRIFTILDLSPHAGISSSEENGTAVTGRARKNLLLIAGGPHPTGDPAGTLRMGFDIAAVGEGEETIIELLKMLSSRSVPIPVAVEDLAGIKGLVFPNADRKKENTLSGARNPIDLDRYPPFAVRHKRFGPIEITRGCPFACNFCQTPQIFGRMPRHRSVARIQEAAMTMKSHGIKDFRAISPNAFSYGSQDGRKLNLAKLEELLSGIARVLGPQGRIFFGSFPSEARPEHVKDETIALLLEYSDNDNLVIGAQSGSQHILTLCHRGHTLDDIYTAVELTQRSKLQAIVDFMFGIPGETEEDIDMTIKVMDDMVKMGARIHAHTFMPLPETPFAAALASPLSARLKRKINNLISRGKLFGDWLEQEKLASKMTLNREEKFPFHKGIQ